MANNQKLPIWFALAAFLLGNGFVFVNPPLKAPDESLHFARAYQVSRLQWVGQQEHGILGGYVPRGIKTLGKQFEEVSYRGVSVAEILDSRRIPFDTHDLTFMTFPNIAAYPWVPFVPQAIGITIGRVCFRSAMAIMYCGREANLIGYIVLVYVGLRMMPHARCRLMLALIAMLPMSLHQAGSLSADGVTIAMSIVVATVVWRLTFLEGPVSGFDLSVLFVSTICLSLTKLAYVPVSLIVLMIPAKRLGGFRRYAAITGAILISNCLAVFLWMRQFRGMPRIDLNPAVKPHEQEQYILHHLGSVAPILISTATHYGKEIGTGVIGTFGWNELMLPLILVVIYYVLLLISIWSNGRPRYWRGTIIAGFTAVITVTAMLAAYYIECRSVGDTDLAGFQGRYLIPLLPLMIFFGGPGQTAGAKFDKLLLIVAVLIGAYSVLFVGQQLYPGFPGSHFYYRFSE
jgi:uncharacterized membrane protein